MCVRGKLVHRLGAKPAAKRDEALRRVGADILNEPIPEKMRQALHGKRGEPEAKAKRRE